ncbi:hypothetical protein ACVFYP_27445 [Roseomonas sp. F4]
MAVLLTEVEGERFDAFCRERGHKKSTLIARLIKEHLNSEGYASQPELFGRGRKAVAVADIRPTRGEGRRKL